MRKFQSFFFSLLLIYLLFTPHFHVSSATSTITPVLRAQVACTMCTACDDPCKPILSPPPPPPPALVSNCPPPPSPPILSPPLPPSVPTFVYYSPPPPSTYGGGGLFYPPPNANNFPTPTPPNPIVPYFPFYYYNPPPAGFVSNAGLKLAKHSIVSSFLLLVFLF